MRMMLVACSALTVAGCQTATMGAAGAAPPTPRASQAGWQTASALPEGTWRVVALGDEGVADDARIDLAFADGRIRGSSGCNRFHGSAVLGASGPLRTGPMASTMMACAEEGRMERERRFLDLLGAVERVETAPDGRMALVTADGTRIVAERAR